MGQCYLLDTGADDDGLLVERSDGLVHQRMTLDEVEREVGQCPGIVCALARSGVRHLGPGHRQPVGVHVVLFLKLALERVQHV